MKIEFNTDDCIHDIKKQFHTLFPFLKIEFFQESGQQDGATSKALVLDNNLAFKELIKSFKPLSFDFESDTQVGAFEKTLSSSLGLQVQVFRKSGNLYLETINTDSWTLTQQNEEGKISQSSPNDEAPKDLTDRDKWE